MTDDDGPTVRVSASEGPRRMEAWARTVGEDLVVVVGGGTRPHVGCVVLAQARSSTSGSGRRSVSSSVLTIPPHKEEPIARGVAESLALALGGTVVVTAGVHDDGLDADGVASYLRLARQLTDDLVTALVTIPRG